jgi:hypothetical protein
MKYGLGLFQEKIPGRVGTPLIFLYLGGGRKTYFFSVFFWGQISI